MNKKLLLAGVSALAFSGCGNEGATTKADYVLSMPGFIATIRGADIRFTLTDPPDADLYDLGALALDARYEINTVTEGLKALGSDPSDSTFELVYPYKSAEGRFGITYVNKSGSYTENNEIWRFSEGKGWYITGDTENKLMTAENKYSPFSDTHHWVVRRKDNKETVWEQQH